MQECQSICLNWSPAQLGGLELPPRSVQVWKASTEHWVEHIATLQGFLSHDERAHAQRIQGNGGRGLLRFLIARYSGGAPGDIKFLQGPFGKPAVPADMGIEFNISHSIDRILLAFARTSRVGIDVEKVQCMTHLDAVAAEILSPTKLAKFQKLTDPEQTRFLFEAFSQEEAGLKATGSGLVGPVADDLVTGWKLWKLELGPDYAAALMVEDIDAVITGWDADQLVL